MRKWVSLLLMVCIGLAAAPTWAQPETDERHPLLEMLSFVPDNETTRAGQINYADLALTESSRYNVVTPANAAEWEALGDEQHYWLEAIQRLQIGFQFRFDSIPEIRETVGFELFDIDRVLNFGVPPARGMILNGQFDSDAIIAAHEARDYTAQPEGDFTFLVNNADADGMTPNAAQREFGNIFDVELGRTPPVVVTEEYALSAFGLDLAQSLVDARQGESATLAEAPDIGTLAQAITAPDFIPGDLVQAVFWRVIDVVNFIGTGLSEAEMEELAETMDPTTLSLFLATVNGPQAQEWENYGELPMYLGAAFFDKQDGETQRNGVALLYATEAEAQMAAEELTRRITTFANELYYRRTEPLIEIMGDTTVEEPMVYQVESTGLWVAVASATYPLQSPEARGISLEEVEGTPLNGTLIRFWINAVYSRSFSPLWLLPPEGE